MKIKKIIGVIAAFAVLMSYSGFIFADENDEPIIEVHEVSEEETAEVSEDYTEEDVPETESSDESTEEDEGQEPSEESETGAEEADTEETESYESEQDESDPCESVEEDDVDEDVEVYVEEDYIPDFGPDNDQLAEQYITNELNSGFGFRAYNRVFDYSSYLEGTDLDVYYNILSQIQAIADGEQTSSIISIPDIVYSADDLGITDLSDKEAIGKAISSILDTRQFVTTLLYSCPYEMYWFDKTVGTRIAYSYSVSSSRRTITVKNLRFTFQVASEYQDDTSADPAHSVNSKFGTALSAARTNIRSILQTYAGLNDYDKLEAYKNAICQLVDYNYPAVQTTTPYGNPWQMVWVFDGDDSTKVVCEGYSKAFQYLCDNSYFSCDDIYAISVTGTSLYTSSGAHMWNIVHMDDGNNYIVDVTNCDSGFPLFLVSAEGSYSTNYKILIRAGRYFTYTYDNVVLGLYSVDALTISDTPYEQEPACVHVIVTDSAVAPSCTETGLTEGSHCSVCGEVIVAQQIVPATGHTPVTDAGYAATCTEPGLSDGSHCSVCDAVITAQQVIPATGHTPVTDAGYAATCTEPGLSDGSHCSVCNAVITAQQVIPATGHTPVTDAGYAATCTEPGLSDGSHCSVCNAVITAQQVIPATGHTPVTDAGYAATCTHTGLSDGSHCSVCNAVITAQQVIPVASHTPVIDPAVPATPTSTGLTEGSHCGECGAILVEQEIVYYEEPEPAKTGWVKEDGKWYYYDMEGEIVTGWNKIGNTWYYFNATGVMLTGWQKISNKWYYFTSGGAMVTGWQKISNKWYYFTSGGAMVTGWQKISNKWYYFEGSGAMKTGWLKLSGKWYYLESSGAMVTGTKVISGKSYRFDSNGVCLNP